MQTLSQGSRGPQVKFLQRLINLKKPGSLVEDGTFGPKTKTQVQAFQTGAKLSPDSIVGPNTWKALGLVVDINHPVKLFAQPTNMTCWSAAATMLVGNMSVGPGGASVGPTGGLGSAYANVEAFAKAHRFTMHPPMTWSVNGFADIARRGPLWVAGTQPLGSPAGPQSGHAVVVGAMWGNGNGDGRGTMLLIYDPWPPNAGSIYGVFYGERLAGSPMGTTYILHR
jgi:hypothetical protein